MVSRATKTAAGLGVVVAALFAFPYWFVSVKNKGPKSPAAFSKTNSLKRPNSVVDAQIAAKTKKEGECH